jgi:hypothetical protein
VEERGAARKEDMVEAEVPERCEGLAVGDDSAECASDGTANAIVLFVGLV